MPIARIVARHGIALRVVQLPRGVSGALFAYPDRRFVLAVSAGLPRTRARFTISHELSHWYLHRGQRWGFMHAGHDSQEEREANRLAAAILMPADAVRYWHSVEAFTSLAARFDVSMEAMHWRLVELGLA